MCHLKRLFWVAVVTLSFWLGYTISTLTAKSPTLISFTGADATRFSSTSGASELNNLLAALPPMAVFSYSDANTQLPITAIPAEAQNLLLAMPGMAVFAYGDGGTYYRIPAFPAELQNLLNTLPGIVAVSYSDASSYRPLAYPADFVDDVTAPLITAQPVLQSEGVSTGLLQWSTNEFARATIEYGTTSGNYPNVVQDPMYETTHQTLLTGLTPQTMYYFRLTNIDLDGNSTTSSEYALYFAGEQKVYLPLIRR